jgi:two-component system sensor histidine kinase BaeS
MGRSGKPWIGRLGLQLALAFVGVALAAVAASILLAGVTASRNLEKLIASQHADVANAAARSAGFAYHRGEWAKSDLQAVFGFGQRTGAVVQVRASDGRVINASPHFGAADPASQMIVPVVISGSTAGSVAVRFVDRGLPSTIQTYEQQRWLSRIGAAGVAAVIALIVALLLSRRITAPVESLIDTARARGRGQAGVRAGSLRGPGEIRELAEAFDEMADASEEQDRVRRNLVADVAHELRTPIAVLQAGHEAIIDGLTEPTPASITSLRDEVLRLARMVGDLQRLASAEAAALQLTLVPGDLAESVSTAADSLADSFAAAGLTLERRLAGARVRCDHLRIHEVTTNLLTNAMKFTPSGGRVVLEVGPDEDPRSGRAVLRVTDTGMGIPEPELPLVTKRFFRGQRSAGIAGTGIGLTIVAELVRAHRGSMAIASEAGGGTQVTIKLPLLVDAAVIGEKLVRPPAADKRTSAAEPEPST